MDKRIVILDKPGKKKLIVPMKKEGEDMEVLGLVMGEKKGDFEMEIVMDHKIGNTRGRVEVRGIAKNGARVRVKGMIKIAKGSQECDDFLEIKILILDNKSWAVVEPKLEIEANEVKASHAVTVSRMDEDQLFYLASRGVKREDAEDLVVKGFLERITDKI